MSATLRSRALGSLIVPIGMLVALGATGCRMGGMQNEPRTSATLLDSAGKQIGVVTLTQTGSGVAVAGDLQGLAAGQHGIHFHTVGRCDAAGAFATAGGHFNPGSRKHGLESSDGPHAGDLPNLSADASGKSTYRATTSRVTLGAGSSSLLDADGSAVVVHATADDQRTDPAGNSGARVACGVISQR